MPRKHTCNKLESYLYIASNIEGKKKKKINTVGQLAATMIQSK